MEAKNIYECTVRLTTSFPDPKQVIEESVDDHFSGSFATVLKWKKMTIEPKHPQSMIR